MKTSRILLGLALGLTTRTALAEDYSDLDSKDEGKKSVQDRIRAEPVREINRGFYLKANVGGAFYLGQFAGAVSGGTSTALAVGQDFLDREKTSMAWEFAFFQGIHNGVTYDQQAGVGPYVEGDLRTYTFAALIEWNGYLGRRLGVGGRVGGGVLFSPLLMERTYYEDEVLRAWGIEDPGLHGQPHPIVQGGPNLEYYTKLAHFSLGLDADVFYAIGWDLGMSVTGNMKYTF
ncbi:MAG: hypothetical protein D6798_13570 [Deltaproteobacteria bacterium]|nr:MAG: hypothetical protein D6798_13570 [Deltaproteobacteria bacterium]